jgi:hypothetical protein
MKIINANIQQKKPVSKFYMLINVYIYIRNYLYDYFTIYILFVLFIFYYIEFYIFMYSNISYAQPRNDMHFFLIRFLYYIIFLYYYHIVFIYYLIDFIYIEGPGTTKKTALCRAVFLSYGLVMT